MEGVALRSSPESVYQPSARAASTAETRQQLLQLLPFISGELLHVSYAYLLNCVLSLWLRDGQTVGIVDTPQSALLLALEAGAMVTFLPLQNSAMFRLLGLRIAKEVSKDRLTAPIQARRAASNHASPPHPGL